MFPITKNLAVLTNLRPVYNLVTKKLFASSFTVGNDTNNIKQYLTKYFPQQAINNNLLKNRVAQISTTNLITGRATIKAINQQSWISSDFHKSYRYSPENWDIEGVITENKGRYSTDCVTINKVISFYDDGILPEYPYDIAIINEFQPMGSSIAFGELQDKSVFFIEYYTTGDDEAGVMIVAPNWQNLIDDIDDNNLYIFIKYLHKDTQQQIREQINTSNKSVRDILKENFS